MGKLVLVEDDPTIRELVAEKLRQKGYQVDVTGQAEDLLGKEIQADLYIVDIMLRGRATGLDLCRDLRDRSATVPILILSALADASDRIEGLRSGADDYLAKPFEMEELLLRIDGMLKRRSWYGRLPAGGSVFTWGENSVDFTKLEGRRGDATFSMSQKECMLLKLLVEKEGQVVSRDEILNQVWGYNVFPSTRTVDNFILRLRRYFEKVPSNPKYLHSVRGMGYKFTSGSKS
jgi:two-component system alkaline phosphatase synthesis response regulator PhoP